MSKSPNGVRVRHGRGCPKQSDLDARCRCTPSYEAFVFDARAGRKIRKTFPTMAAARGWRADALVAVRKGTVAASTSTTFRAAAEAWLVGARDGSIRTRSGDAYKPSTLRGYEEALRVRILDELGAKKLGDVRRADVQDIADRMLAAGMDASTIRNALMPLRAIYRRALVRGEVAVNPTTGLELPAVRGRRERIASRQEAAALLAALDDDHDRAVWATALYAGLRLGELRALRAEDVDLAAGVIRVERSWDRHEGVIEPKSRAGRRRVPIVAALRVHLVAWKLRRGGGELFFGDGYDPFNRDGLVVRANRAWKAAAQTQIGLHEARHTYASLMIAAGVNAKALSTFMGHSSITITLDRYGHLMPGSEGEAVALADAYLGGVAEAAR
jgi:integrase